MNIDLFVVSETKNKWNYSDIVDHQLLSAHTIEFFQFTSTNGLLKKIKAPSKPHVILLMCQNMSEGLKMVNQLLKITDSIILCCDHDDQENKDSNELKNIHALFVGKRLNNKQLCISLLSCIKQWESNLIKKKPIAPNNEILSELLNTSPYGIQISDNHGQITFHNQAHQRIFNYAEKDVTHKHVWDLIHDSNEKKEYEKYYKTIVTKDTEPSIYFIHDVLPNGKELITQHVWNYIKNHKNEKSGVFTIISDRTEQLEAEQNLEASEERNRTLIEQLPEALVVHKQGTIIFINPIATKLFGGKPEDYIGQSVLQFIAEEYHDLVKQRLAKSKQSNDPLPVVEEKLVKSNGETLDVEVNSIPIRFENENCSLVMLRDITEHKQIENELIEAKEKAEESQKRYKTIFESSREGIMIFASEEELAYINPSGCQMFGYSKAEMLEMNPMAYIHPNSKNKFLEFIHLLNDGKEYNDEASGIHKSGAKIDFTVYGCPMEIGGQKLFFCTLIDVTKQKKYEAELIAAKNRAEEADRLKSSFLANMSHEVRTPMNGIIGFSEMLKQPNLDNDKKLYYTDIIIKSCHQLLTIINDIVDISKIESGQVEIYLEDININQLINEMYKLFQPMAESKKVEFSSKKELPDNACTANTDPIRLKQILNNLLSNAFKFTKEGRVTFGYQIKSDAIWFYVQDTGIGIHEKNISVIFERFRQLEMDATRNYGGNGLGLSISKALVEKMGGKIWVDSTLAKGSTFYFSIPYKNQNVKMEESKSQDSIDTSKMADKTILVAEDEDINFLFIKEIFAGTDINIIRAINGKEAVDIVKENKSIALVLMDIKMPVLDGYEATKQIKSMRKDIPVIAQTAYAMSGDKEKSIEAGCDDYISKPIKKQELMNKMKEYIKS